MWAENKIARLANLFVGGKKYSKKGGGVLGERNVGLLLPALLEARQYLASENMCCFSAIL